MALFPVTLWRGLVRLRIREARGRLQSLVQYNSQHPQVGLFTPAELAQVQATITLLTNLLSATRLN